MEFQGIGPVDGIDMASIAELRKATLALGGPTIFSKLNASDRGRVPKRVKNLGWLLRNWRNVRYFYRVDTFLVAEIHGGDWSGFYCCDWASEASMLEWLNRPVFRDVEIYTLDKL